MKYRPMLLAAALFLGLSACVDEINLDTGPLPDSGMLVQGRLVQGETAIVQATVFELFVNPNNLPRPIGNSDVVLHNNQGQSITLTPNYDGTYFREIEADNPGFSVAAGQLFRLTVTLPNGQGYSSAWESLLPVRPIDSVSVRVYEKEIINFEGELETKRFVGFGAYTSLLAPNTQEPARYRWEVRQAYRLTEEARHPAYLDAIPKTCYILTPANTENIVVLNGAELSPTYLEDFLIWETPADSRFYEGFYLIAYQQSLTEEAFRYWDEAAQLLARRGTLFDPPPGALRTNISSTDNPNEMAFGYFYATQQNVFRQYISPGAIPGVSRQCPYPPPLPGEELPPPNECDDCLLQGGSQLERPEWWVE